MMRPCSFQTVLALLLLASAGCSRDVIPNTDVPDTDRNREVVEFVESYREAVENQNIGKLLELASKRYLDDNGTPVGNDDIDMEALKKKLSRWKKEVKDVRYEIRYRRVTFQRERVLVDYTYTASFQVQGPEGKRWARRLADNRIVLKHNDKIGEYRILSGM
jgi:hypothetical protein